MSHCPARSRLLSSSRRSSRGPRLRRTRECVRYLHICHAQFVQTVLEKVLFRGREIAFRLFREQAKSIDGLSCADDIHLRLFALTPHQAHLQHRRHIQRGQELLERDLKIANGVPALLDLFIEFLRRVAICGSLRLLLGRRRHWRHFAISCGSIRLNALRWLGWGFFGCSLRRGLFFFFCHLRPQFAVRRKQSPVSHCETRIVFLVSHNPSPHHNRLNPYYAGRATRSVAFASAHNVLSGTGSVTTVAFTPPSMTSRPGVPSSRRMYPRATFL